MSLAVDGDGNWLVADTGNNRLQLLTPDGAHLKTIGSEGSGPGQSKYSYGVAMNGDGSRRISVAHDPIKPISSDQ